MVMIILRPRARMVKFTSRLSVLSEVRVFPPYLANGWSWRNVKIFRAVPSWIKIWMKKGRKASASFSPNNYKCISSKEHWPRPKFDGCASLIGLSLSLFRYKILEGWSFSRKHANILARKVLVQAKLHGVLEFCKLSETGFCSSEQPQGYWGFRVFVLFVLSLWKSHGILERIFF
jgi:hypothetical protein